MKRKYKAIRVQGMTEEEIATIEAYSKCSKPSNRIKFDMLEAMAWRIKNPLKRLKG